MLANQTPVAEVVVGIVVLIGLGVGALYLFRGYEHLARRSLHRKYADLAVHGDPQPGDVVLIYHSYHGFIGWFTQTPHQVALSPKDARKLLGRLFRFNLTWGLVTYGTIFIVPLSILNYFAQRRAIAVQEAGGPTGSILRPTDTAVIETSAAPDSATLDSSSDSDSPSSFRRIVGWIAAGLSVMFSVSVLVCIITGELQAAAGGVMVAVLLGLVAKDWLGKSRAGAG